MERKNGLRFVYSNTMNRRSLVPGFDVVSPFEQPFGYPLLNVTRYPNVPGAREIHGPGSGVNVDEWMEGVQSGPWLASFRRGFHAPLPTCDLA